MSLLRKGGDARMFLRTLFTDPWGTPEEREIEIDGVRMSIRRRSSDLFVVREVFRRHVYGSPPSGIVVDLGANIGAYALYAARTASQVFAFEPESSNFTQLQKNIALNRRLPVHIFKKAAGGTNGTRTLYPAAINKGASSFLTKHSGESEPVEMITLDHVLALCGLTHVDFLKVDIEGGEYELIDSASVHTLRRIRALAMETHRVPGKRYRDLVAKIESAGFTVQHAWTRRFFGMRMLFAKRDV